MDEQLERDADDVSDPVLHPDFLAAVRRVTEAALAADEPGLIRPPTEWFAMVQRHMPHARIGRSWTRPWSRCSTRHRRSSP